MSVWENVLIRRCRACGYTTRQAGMAACPSCGASHETIQKCRKCKGKGTVSVPSSVTGQRMICGLCDGQKIVYLTAKHNAFQVAQSD